MFLVLTYCSDAQLEPEVQPCVVLIIHENTALLLANSVIHILNGYHL